jgi:hypothetical protein
MINIPFEVPTPKQLADLHSQWRIADEEWSRQAALVQNHKLRALSLRDLLEEAEFKAKVAALGAERLAVLALPQPPLDRKRHWWVKHGWAVGRHNNMVFGEWTEQARRARRMLGVE